MLNYWFWSQNYRFEGSRTIGGALSSRQINSVSPESLVTSTVFITSDHLWDARDQLLIPNCLGNMAETNPDFRKQCIHLISVKTWNVIFPSSSHLIFQVTLSGDDYMLLNSDWGLPQRWLSESLVKELLYRRLAGALRAGVMEGVYLDAASGNQRLLSNLQEA